MSNDDVHDHVSGVDPIDSIDKTDPSAQQPPITPEPSSTDPEPLIAHVTHPENAAPNIADDHRAAVGEQRAAGLEDPDRV